MTPPPAAAAAPQPVRRRPVPATRPARRGGRSAPVLPRRVSGPVRARVRAGARAHAHTELKLIPHQLLDRLIRGRLWIGLVAFALIGIVAMQLWIVKLGVGIGRAIEHEGLLRRENAVLSIEDAGLSSGERVERLAAAKGMVEAAPGALHFDSLRGALDARLAAGALARDAQADPGTVPAAAAPAAGTGETNTPAATGEASTPAATGEATAAATAAGATSASVTGEGASTASGEAPAPTATGEATPSG